LKRFRVPLFIGAGSLVVALIIFATWISPEGSHLKKLQAQQTELQSQQSALQIRIAALKKEKSQLGTDCQQLSTDLTEIPSAPDVDSFLSQVTNLAVSSGDPSTPTISVTQASTAAAGGVSPVSVSLTLSGTYGQMMSFLQGLDSFPRLFTVTNIAVTGGSVVTGGQAVAPSAAGYSLSLSGDIYYSSGQENVCASSGATST
jgi:Tfp pilus assembly protein PilO